MLLPVTLFLFTAGCASPPKHPYTIKSGGYLDAKDYAALQQAADRVPPTPLPKSWPNPTPQWSYYIDTKIDPRAFDTIAIPDLETRLTIDSELSKGIRDAIVKELIKKRLVKGITNSSSDASLALVGAVTRYQKGSLLAMSAQRVHSYLQTEFTITMNGEKVGAIQAYAVRGKGLVVSLASKNIESQIAEDLVQVVRGLKENVPAKAAEGGPIPDWYEQ